MRWVEGGSGHSPGCKFQPCLGSRGRGEGQGKQRKGGRREEKGESPEGGAALTERFEHLHPTELALEEDGVVQGVERADHADQEHLEAT